MERTVDQAELLLNNMLTNENNQTLPEPILEAIPEPIEPTPEPIPKPTPKKRGVLFLSPEDMQEAKKSMKEKGIKAEDVNIYHLLRRYMVLIYCLLKNHIVWITRDKQ